MTTNQQKSLKMENIQLQEGEKEFHHERILNMQEMQPSFLDNFDISQFNFPKISAVVPTYNRAPHTAEDDANPLGWCLESLLAQKGNILDEIIVMDDASTDFTQEVVEDFQGKSHINIKYFKNEENRGSSINKNRAAEKSKNEHIIFLDDDCVFSNYFIFGAAFTMGSLPDTAGALHMPVYHRRLNPTPIEMEEIGILDLKTGKMTGNHGGFPTNYAKNLEENLLNKEMAIVNPLKISNLAGIFLAKKSLFQKVGGFPENLTWKNGYREEAHISLNLMEAGYDLYFTPDPKFHSVHLKYGSKGAEGEIENANPKLKRLITYSSVQRENTGNRVDPEEWFFDRIISTYVTLGQRNIEAANNYLKQAEEEFVTRNELSVSGFGMKIHDFAKRKNIFERAVEEGNKLIQRKTG